MKQSDKSDERPSTHDLVAGRVNRNGELHLDREFTALLLRLLENDEMHLTAAVTLIAEARTLFEPLLSRLSKSEESDKSDGRP